MSDKTWSQKFEEANAAAKAAGASDARELIAKAKEIAATAGVSEKEMVLSLILDRVFELSTNDNWSGRGNDSQRSYRDGFISASRTVTL